MEKKIEGKLKDSHLLISKLTMKATVIKTVTGIKTDVQINGTECKNPEINSHMDGQLIFTKGVKTIQ